MLKRHRAKSIAELALPIMGGMLSGNILSLVDTAMVGSLGDSALAAVGLGATAMAFAISVVFGLSAAVQAVAARRSGEGAVEREAEPLNAGLLLAVVIGSLFSFLYIALTPFFYNSLTSDSEVTALGIPYLSISMIAMPALGLNFSFRGFYHGIGKPVYHLRISVLIHSVNILLNYLLIFGKAGFPAMGCTGAGLASCIAIYVGSLTYFYLSFKDARAMGFLKAIPPVTQFRKLIALAAPVGLQNLLMSLGGMVVLAMVALIGTAHLAAGNVLIRIMRVLLFPGIALGFASRTLVGQALGRKDPSDATRWGWDVTFLSFLVFTLLGLPLACVPRLVLAGFIQDPATIELAVLPGRLLGAFAGIAGIGQMLVYPLQGGGDNHWVMIRAASLYWLFFLPLAWLLAIRLDLALLGIFSAQISYGLLMTYVFARRWHGGHWQKYKL